MRYCLRKKLMPCVTIQGKSELLDIVNSEKSEIEKLLEIGAVGNAEKYKIDREQRALEVEIASLEENIVIKNSEIEGLSKEIDALQSEYDAKILREINDLELANIGAKCEKASI